MQMQRPILSALLSALRWCRCAECCCRSQSTRTFNKGGMGLRKTSADSLSTLHRLEECASFSNPFSGRNSSSQGAWGTSREYASKENKVGSRPMPVNPWSAAVPMHAKSGSLRGVQRGNSAAMEILRSSPQEYLMGELPPESFKKTLHSCVSHVQGKAPLPRQAPPPASPQG